MAALIGMSGPLLGRVIELTEGELTIGRDDANDLCISDPSISRRHCAIHADDGQFLVRDLQSHNGTQVNGATVTQHVLQHGDHITLGRTQFTFVLRDQTVSPVALRCEDTDDLTPAAEVAATQIGVTAPTRSPGATAADDLRALLTIASRVGAIRSSDAIAWQLTGMLFDVLPAERAAVLLYNGSDALTAAAAWDRVAGPTHDVRVSRTVTQRVLKNKVALLANNAGAFESALRSQSLQDLGIHSVLCAPMMAGDSLVGVIYADARRLTSQFTQHHLELLLAIAGIAGLALEHARRFELLEFENAQLRSVINLEHNMVGDSGPMKDVYRFIAKVAPTEATVLVLGESGTGKELIARAIHRNSNRAQAPIAAINCAAITETLLESELFGYEKGAFTGAVAQKKGRLEAANGGTVFLDEIGELAPSLQAKLLRVLQDHELVRVGGTQSIKIDVRVIAATNRDLAAQVRAGSFREDLYYRLNVVSVRAPALRERRDDIPALAQYFVEKCSARCKRRVAGISPEALTCLSAYDWPGNVRELENAIERAVVLGSTDMLMADDLPDAVLETASTATPGAATFHESVAEHKRELIIEAVKASGGNYTEAARKLGLHPNYLHRLIRLLDIRDVVKKTAAS
jgi:transcriptional regulator with GAF, ATPase, and Fis domain